MNVMCSPDLVADLDHVIFIDIQAPMQGRRPETAGKGTGPGKIYLKTSSGTCTAVQLHLFTRVTVVSL